MSETPDTDYVSLIAEAHRYALDLEARLNGKVCEPAETEAAIAYVYLQLGLSRPRIIWCESVLQLSNLPWMIEFLWQQPQAWLRSDLFAELKADGLSAAVGSRIGQKRLYARVRELLKGETPIRLGKSLSSTVSERVLKKLAPDLATAAARAISEDAKERIENSTRDVFLGFTNRLKETCRQHARLPGMAIALGHGLALPPGKLNQMESVVQEFNPSSMAVDSWGVWDLYWLSSYAFLIKALDKSVFMSEAAKETENWLMIMKNGSPYLFFENVCFVSKYPTTRSMDNAYRWHNETGPALVLEDGQRFYFWHGTEIPSYLIEHRRFVTPLTIALQANATLRSIMIEIYGWDKYLRESKAERIDEDENGILFRLESGNSEPLVAVEVRNSTAEPDGSFKRFLLRVPPDMTTVRQAVAWTFQMNKSDYNPDIET